MGIIRVLDEQLANQIAAGEVVERPASVVKELVENAVDAGATTIDIAVEEGGLQLIRVTDNGSGIQHEDMEIAFSRHATSKIQSDRDLFRIASLGFRGEALPSIAAVARVSCVSSAEDSGLGRLIRMEGGKLTADEHAGASQGTDMSVSDLFFNTPARLKYMKSIQTELGHISDYVYRIALAHPGIAFSLTHNGGSLLRTRGDGDRLQVIAAVYGTNTAKAMIPVQGDHPDYDLQGFISKPELTRANRNGITTIVNGRYIRSYAVQQALLQAYHTLLPINRFPLAVLEIGMHPGLVDVNVHPSKLEVRFSKEAELREFVEHVAGEALGKRRHIPGPDAGRAENSKPVFKQEEIRFHRPESAFAPDRANAGGTGRKPAEPGWAPKGYRNDRRDDAPASPPIPRDAAERLYGRVQPEGALFREAGADWTAGRLPARAADANAETVAAETAAASAAASPLQAAPYPDADEKKNAADSSAILSDDGAAIFSGDSAAVPSEDSAAVRSADSAAGTYAAETGTATEGAGDFPELSWVGQLHGTYLIAQNADGMYLIDQHAAHERINYEYYYRKFGTPLAASQQLIVPFTLEYTSSEAANLTQLLPLLTEAGVELEPFGTNAFLVRSHPEWLPKGDEQSVIAEIVEWVLSEKKAVDIAKLREKSAILCSCKASIKANDRMNREEGEFLLARLAACSQPYTCPHGRPILVHISTYQLEKMFKRVM
ncbi:DNA mismatch repair endonuclease MutL [Paenibacillus beijingensis]|uniref:DNA mismatch repair protein MutL n=1 Tax=Paenibacillus beijingensis TaxID=1126833 RepID=A0A0D5NPI4_9BACL|nr:DNA mismatch repair endonuclease MutL [Paenibacillus beijingensis]AJY77090.1 hypothetical protein VN24_24250 [Paenibacillus beijingensis]